MRNPDQWERLCVDPVGLCASATEECLRYEPSVVFLSRVAKHDVELGRAIIRAGDKVFWVIGSANRDPRVFPNPDSFDITRSPNPHLTFGGGVHHCIGAALARVEGQEAFRALAESFPRLRLQSEDIERFQSSGIRALRSLRVSWN